MMFGGFCGSPVHKVFNCLYQSRSRDIFASVVIQESVKASYDEHRVSLSKALDQFKTFDPDSADQQPPALMPLESDHSACIPQPLPN
jgi:hypothetical protein